MKENKNFKKLMIFTIMATMCLSALVLLPTASAATINVPGDYSTIQAAIDNANPGDTIMVSAGTYTEDLTIDKDVILQGANAGIPGDGTRGSESIIDGFITVTGDGATIDGFAIESTFTSGGVVFVDIAANEVTFQNNVQTISTPSDCGGSTAVRMLGENGLIDSNWFEWTGCLKDRGDSFVFVDDGSDGTVVSNNDIIGARLITDLAATDTVTFDSNTITYDTSGWGCTDIIFVGGPAPFDGTLIMNGNTANGQPFSHSVRRSSTLHFFIDFNDATDFACNNAGIVVKDLSNAHFIVVDCLLIQDALDIARDGDTIEVAMGTYNEQLLIEKSVNLFGAQYDVDARTRNSPSEESVLYGNIGFPNNNPVDDVTIDGLFIEGALHAHFAGDNLQVSNNVFEDIDNTQGYMIGHGGHAEPCNTGWMIEQNRLDGISNTLASCMRLWNLKELTVQNNLISDIPFAGIHLDTVEDAEITGNEITNCEHQGIHIATSPSNPNLTLIQNNFLHDIGSSADIDEGAITIWPNAENIEVKHNNLTNNYNGIAIKDEIGSVASNIHITQNNIYDNNNGGIANYAQSGGMLPATCNWWGSATGPSGDGPGIGDAVQEISGTIDYHPWLTDAYPNGDCVGGLCADTIYVNDDASSGWYDYEHVATIQTGVDHVCSYGTIYVHPGYYDEMITIDKPLTLVSTDGSNVTTIQKMVNTLITVEADEVTIDGFTLIGDNSFESQRKGIFIPGSYSNIEIMNCDITASAPIWVHWTGSSHTDIVIENNVLHDGDWGLVLFNVDDSVISNNDFSAFSDLGIQLTSWGSRPLPSNNIIDHNMFDAIVYHDLLLQARDTTVEYNDILGGGDYGVGIANELQGYTDVFVVSGNVIHCNNISGHLKQGVATGYHTGIKPGVFQVSFIPEVVDASCNWWGDCSGPFNASWNPIGLGDVVSGNVIADPWVGQVFADAGGPYVDDDCDDTYSINFDGSGSMASVCCGGTVSFEWDFGDGSTGSGMTPTHVYSSFGEYTVSITVMVNALGQTCVHTNITTVEIFGVTADAGGPYVDDDCDDTYSISFDGSGSVGYETPLSYEWDFGDGNTGSGMNPTHMYDNLGMYTVEVTVTDNSGNCVDTDSATVEIFGVTADAGGPYVLSEDTYTVHFIGSARGHQPPFTFEWDFGDGTTSSEQNPYHTYENNGNYTVSLTVNESGNGCSDTDVTSVYVTGDDPPIVQLEYPVGGERLTGTVTVEWSATDNTYVSGIYLYYSAEGDDAWHQLDGVLENTGAYDWNTDQLSDGDYRLQVVAMDSKGGMSHDSSDVFNVGNGYAGARVSSLNFDKEYVKDGDMITVTAGITGGQSLVEKDIVADFSAFGLGTAVSADSFDGFTAVWTVSGLVCSPADGVLEVVVYAGDDSRVGSVVADNTVPDLTLVKPKVGLYLFNQRILPLSNTVIVGGITVEIEAFDERSGVKSIEMFIDDEYKGAGDSYYLNERMIGRYILEVKVFDNVGNVNSMTQSLRIFNPFGRN